MVGSLSKCSGVAAARGGVYVESSPEKVTPAPAEKPFGELSIDEKVTLHRAFYEGKTIQARFSGSSEWDCTKYPEWNWNKFYRVKPEPEPRKVDVEFVVDMLMGLLTQYEDDGFPMTDVNGNDTGKTVKVAAECGASWIDLYIDGKLFAIEID